MVLFRDSNRNAVDIVRKKKKKEENTKEVFGVRRFLYQFLTQVEGLEIWVGFIGLRPGTHILCRPQIPVRLFEPHGTRRADGKRVASVAGSWSFDV